MRVRWRLLVLSLWFSMLSLGNAQTLSTPQPCDASPFPTVLTVEGGGSLGVYEAGMTYLLVNIFKRKWLNAEVSPRIDSLRPLCLSVVTGASAGNINAFLAASDWCDARLTDSPERSLFWSTWVTTGLMQLFPTRGEEPKDTALLSRRHFDGYLQQALRKSWGNARWIPDCHVQFGATVTRLYADSVRGAGAMYARNQRMAFAFSIEGIDSVPILRPFAASAENYSFGALKSLRPNRDNRILWTDAFGLIETSSG